MHLGLIGGIGPAATEFYYRGLVRGHAAANARLDVTIVHAQTRDLLANMMAGEAEKQAEIFLGFVRRLQAAGADAAVVTSLAGHFCIGELEAISPLPLLNAIPILNDHFSRAGISRVGLLGTGPVLTSRLYGGVSTVQIVIPEGDDLEATHANYTQMARSGQATEAQRAFFLAQGERLCRDQGADAVALAGTDLFLAFDGADCGFPVIDCAQVHIDALISASTGHE